MILFLPEETSEALMASEALDVVVSLELGVGVVVVVVLFWLGDPLLACGAATAAAAGAAGVEAAGEEAGSAGACVLG